MMGRVRLSTVFEERDDSIGEMSELPSDFVRVLAELGLLADLVFQHLLEFLEFHPHGGVCRSDLLSWCWPDMTKNI